MDDGRWNTVQTPGLLLACLVVAIVAAQPAAAGCTDPDNDLI